MFRTARRVDRVTTVERAYDILNEAEYGTFTVFGDDGYPYGVPVNHTMLNGSIYFHSSVIGKKLDSISLNNKCGFTAVLYANVLPEKLTTQYACTICMGTAKVVEGEEEVLALRAISEKYSSAFPDVIKDKTKASQKRVSIIKITIDHISGKENK